MRSMFGWSYPPGAENDPHAPWNEREEEEEHEEEWEPEEETDDAQSK